VAWWVGQPNIPFTAPQGDLYVALVTKVANYTMAGDQWWNVKMAIETAPQLV
jgi:hypothetical protein